MKSLIILSILVIVIGAGAVMYFSDYDIKDTVTNTVANYQETGNIGEVIVASGSTLSTVNSLTVISNTPDEFTDVEIMKSFSVSLTGNSNVTEIVRDGFYTDASTIESVLKKSSKIVPMETEPIINVEVSRSEETMDIIVNYKFSVGVNESENLSEVISQLTSLDDTIIQNAIHKEDERIADEDAILGSIIQNAIYEESKKKELNDKEIAEIIQNAVNKEDERIAALSGDEKNE